jgi:hypothetical protein
MKEADRKKKKKQQSFFFWSMRKFTSLLAFWRCASTHYGAMLSSVKRFQNDEKAHRRLCRAQGIN